MQTEETHTNLNENLWSLEDLQEKVQTKLTNIFSFYNEQEFLDQINWIEPVFDVIEVDMNDE